MTDEVLIGLLRDGALGGAAILLVLRLDSAIRALSMRIDALPCQSGGDCRARGPGPASRAVLLALLVLGGLVQCAAARSVLVDERTACAAACGAEARACLERCDSLPLLPEGSPPRPGGPLGGQPEGGG